MNTQQVRLSNTNHMMVQHSRGSRVPTNGYAVGEELRVREDVDLQVEQEIVSVPKGSAATVRENNSQHVLLDLGEGLGKFVMEIGKVNQYFERAPRTESTAPNRRRVQESNPLVATPGAYVEITSYDPKIGPNRGPKSPGMGGYQTLIGQKGQIATLFNLNVPGVMTYKVQLEKGGEFIFGDTEFKVLPNAGSQRESVEPDLQALRAVGYSL